MPHNTQEKKEGAYCPRPATNSQKQKQCTPIIPAPGSKGNREFNLSVDAPRYFRLWDTKVEEWFGWDADGDEFHTPNFSEAPIFNTASTYFMEGLQQDFPKLQPKYLPEDQQLRLNGLGVSLWGES